MILIMILCIPRQGMKKETGCKFKSIFIPNCLKTPSGLKMHIWTPQSPLTLWMQKALRSLAAVSLSFHVKSTICKNFIFIFSSFFYLSLTTKTFLEKCIIPNALTVNLSMVPLWKRSQKSYPTFPSAFFSVRS